MVLLVLKAVMEKYVYVQYHRDKSLLHCKATIAETGSWECGTEAHLF